MEEKNNPFEFIARVQDLTRHKTKGNLGPNKHGLVTYI